jgi:hypothetical protein
MTAKIGKKFYSTWQKNGKFDFCICTHTLEDIANPSTAVRMIDRISKAGFVSTPSKYDEFIRSKDKFNSNYRGYIHHRWIFSIYNGAWTAYPKQNFLDFESSFDKLTDNGKALMYGELSFMWTGKIELKIVNDDYLGPNSDAVISYYQEQLLHRSDDDRWIDLTLTTSCDKEMQLPAASLQWQSSCKDCYYDFEGDMNSIRKFHRNNKSPEYLKYWSDRGLLLRCSR